MLIVAGVVVLVAAGAVGYVIYKQMAAKPQTEAVVVESQGVKPAAVKASVRSRPAPVETVAVPVAEPAASETSATSAVAAETGSFDANALLGKLDKKQQDALQAAMFSQMIRQSMKGARYQLPVLGKIRTLDFQEQGKNKLTAAQQAQLKTVMQNIKPQMDVALKELWAKQDELMGQAGQLITKGMADPSAAMNDPQLQQQAESLQAQAEDLEKAMQPQMAVFDQQVLAGMTPYLTPAQLAALQAMPAGGTFTNTNPPPLP
jgi:hypothetical protein